MGASHSKFRASQRFPCPNQAQNALEKIRRTILRRKKRVGKKPTPMFMVLVLLLVPLPVLVCWG